MEILLVDDETAFARSLADGLEMVGERFHVITAENGKQAVNILQTTPFDLVITDLNMPVMDGFELLEYLQRERPGIRVIVMSMLNGPEVFSRLNELGVTRFIEKPVDFYTVLNRILAV
jgi:CheY-like chemotaxis protein